jgi:hypothetical protein
MSVTHTKHTFWQFLRGTENHLSHVTSHRRVQHKTYISTCAEITPQPRALSPHHRGLTCYGNTQCYMALAETECQTEVSQSDLSWKELTSNSTASFPLFASHAFFALLLFSSSFCQFHARSSLKVCIFPPSSPHTPIPILLLPHSPYFSYPEDVDSRHLSIQLKDCTLKVILTTEFFWNITLQCWLSRSHHFRGSQSLHVQAEAQSSCTVWPWKTKALVSFETLGTIGSATQHHISEGLYLQQ